MVCPLSLPVDVGVTSKVPIPPLVVVDNDMVEALKDELVKCKSDHERQLELTCFKDMKKGPRVEGPD